MLGGTPSCDIIQSTSGKNEKTGDLILGLLLV
jgi:hypothetical protein